MSVSIDTFWKLALESRALTGEQQQRLAAEFANMRGASEAGASAMAQWLVAQRVLSRYQTKVLLAGRPGPFIYGDYQVFDRIDSGRLQGLYRAEHRATGQLVCLTFLHGADAQDPLRFGQIVQLATSASQVRSPFVARCYQAVDLGAFKFLALADLQGQTLEEKLAGGPLPAAEVCQIGRQVALGLAELHKSGQTHGDMRPENIWLGSSGQARLLAFPLHREPLAKPTSPAGANGKLAEMADYLAPEVITTGQAEPRSDIYSLGCVLYRALTGQPPFAGGDLQQKLARHTQENAPLANQAQPTVPEPVAQVIGYMLAKDPAGRYQQATHVADSLAPYLSSGAAREIQEPTTAASQAFESWLAHQSQPAPASSQTPQAVQPVANPVAQAAPVQAAPVQAAPVQAAPVQAAPIQAAPIQAAPIQAASVQAVVSQGVSAGGAQPKTASGSAGALAARRAQRSGDRQNRNTMLACGGVLGAALVALILFKVASEPEAEPDQGNYPPAASTRTVASGETQTSPTSSTPAATTPRGAATTNGENPGVGRTTPSPTPEGPRREPITALEPGGQVWASPTDGSPLDLRYLPNGAQMILALRPADLVLQEEGPKLLQTLGPLGTLAQQSLIKKCGVSSFDNLEQVVIGVIPTTGGRPPRFAMVATTTAPITEQTLRQSLPNSETGRLEGQKVITTADLGYFLPPDRQNLIVVAPLEPDRAGGETKPPIAEAIANGASPAPLRREMEALLPNTDSRRLFTMLVAPNFPFTDGKAVWAGPTDIAKRPTELFFLGEREAKAVAFSLHLSGQDLFMELRVYGTSDVASRALAQYFETRLRDELPRMVMDYCVSLNPSAYSKKILLSYPIMVRTMVDNLDAGATPSHAVFRCYLPSYAASSLAYGTYLALVERPGAGPAQVASGAPQAAKPKTAHEILEKTKMDLTFPRDTLEQSMVMISNEIGVPIQILGGDLQLEGITKNQSFGLDEKGKSPGQILRTIMQKANSDGKLIYVIAKDGDKEVIHITTRASAAKRGDKLPPELVEKK